MIKSIYLLISISIITGCGTPYMSDFVRHHNPSDVEYEQFNGRITYHEDFAFHIGAPKTRVHSGLSSVHSWGQYIGWISGAVPATMGIKWFFPGFAIGYALQSPASFLFGYVRSEVRLLERYCVEEHKAIYQVLISRINERIRETHDVMESRELIVWESGIISWEPFPYRRLYFYIVFSDADEEDHYVIYSIRDFSLKLWLRYFEKLAALEIDDPDVGWFFEWGKRPVIR